jgi:hypothetical protein
MFIAGIAHHYFFAYFIDLVFHFRWGALDVERLAAPHAVN